MKNPSAVGLAALGMFTYGLVKAWAVLGPGSEQHGEGCPLCAAASAMSPSRLAHSVLLGPLMEEVNFRDTLPRLVGDQASAMAFGAMHASPGLGVLGNALRVLEAGLAGGFIYAPAFKNGGLLGSTLVHGAHNLGAAVGLFSVMKRRVADEGWEKVPVLVATSHDTEPVMALVCRRRGGPLRL